MLYCTLSLHPHRPRDLEAKDLLVVSPERRRFEIDIKGQSTRNFWLIQRREPEEDLFFVLVYLPKDFKPPHSYVLSSAELVKL